MTLNIGTKESGKPFTLGLSLATSTQAILARKRSGKSYTASVEAEELLERKQQIAVVDPTGAWYGLQSSTDGKKEGHPVIVFGGDHADAPLDYRAGKAMAVALIEQGFSAIFDVSNLHTEEQIEFVKDFCSEMLRINRQAIHIFMDEADTFAPQKPLGLLQNKCLGTVSRLVKQGGIRGIGFTMITQRPASINKDVLSQVDILTILRMSHPLDIKAATDWIKSEVSTDFAKLVENSLPSLPVGTAFFCSASLGIGDKVQVRTRKTFNSGATPKPGERKIEPKVLAKVDIEKLGQKIAESVKRTREESPEFLKKRIAELEKEVAKGGKPSMELTRHIEELEKKAARLDQTEAALAQRDNAISAVLSGLEQLAREAYTIHAVLARNTSGAEAIKLPDPPSEAAGFKTASSPKEPYKALERAPVTPIARPQSTPVGKESDLPNRILRALAEFEAIGRTEILRNVLSAWAGARGGYFKNTLSKMKTEGLIEYRSAGMVAMTDDGRSRAPHIARPATPDDFFNAVLVQAGSGLPERILLRLKMDYPDGLSREELSVSVDARGGYFNNTLSGLKTAGFVEYPRNGQVRLQPWTVME